MKFVSISFSDVLFGIPWGKTGISRYFIRNKQRTISFAVTVVLKSYHNGYVSLEA